MKRNELLVIFEGETLWGAMQRHWRDYGPGHLVLVLDRNSRRQARQMGARR